MSRPFMPFYDGDWMRDTAHLDDHQERAYFRLVTFYWASGSLPTDEAQLARICRMTPAKWRKNRQVLAAFFDANWVHGRIEKELEKSNRFIEKQRLNGAKPKARQEPNEYQIETRARVPQPQPHPNVEGSNSEEDKSSSGATAPNNRDVPPSWWPHRDTWGRVQSDITEKIMFDVGKAVLGKSAGGQITKMRKLYRNDMRAVTDLLLQAHEKSEPAQWWAAALKRAEVDEHLPPKHEIYPEHSY